MTKALIAIRLGGGGAALLGAGAGPRGGFRLAGSSSQVLCAFLVSGLTVPVGLAVFAWGIYTLRSAKSFQSLLCEERHWE